MAELHGLYMVVILTTYKSGDDPPAVLAIFSHTPGLAWWTRRILQHHPFRHRSSKGGGRGVANHEGKLGNKKDLLVVVSQIFLFSPLLGEMIKLPNIFQMGWNHHLAFVGLSNEKYATENKYGNGNSLFSIGDTSSNGWSFHCHFSFQGCIHFFPTIHLKQICTEEFLTWGSTKTHHFQSQKKTNR